MAGARSSLFRSWPQGLTVTVIHPGATRTEKTADTVARKAQSESTDAQQAERALFGGNLLGCIVEAEEIAHIATFLASPLSAAINAAGGGTPRAIHY
jgi:NAD(P)-dependent dehydrogenase (short-subunit alcohol dehydrogenase family)